MNAAALSVSQTSIIPHVLLGRADSTLRTAIQALELQAILFARIELLVAEGDDVVDLVQFGCRTISDAVIDCREHANEGDIVGLFDCLTRVLSGHRAARSLLSAIVELGNVEVSEVARLGISLAVSVLNDLGCDNAG
jgi:hypothetical protein